ncbi:hypothetical protein KORDIASMS9_03927 [Kordia sp. SMS9]|uniref:hypothetical protein n=1 Tax=Kordia sp. SMS9 TaxID=2282170 RepID=UPI000E0CDABC|nr:hypothetical protein [Kordia sp. SMS9]AXG71670.1 hypothetical protein KORDIASMS9_03927 [Kordia sp. SMS9]
MKLKTIITFALLSILFINCKSEEEKMIEKFLQYTKNTNIKELKKISSKNTRKYLKLIYEPILRLGDKDAKEKLQKMASSIKCTVEDKISKCSYADHQGNKHSFNISFVNGYDSQKNEDRLFIDIDKKYFFNSTN